MTSAQTERTGSSQTRRPFRFTFGTGMSVTSPGQVIELAQRLEELGYGGIALPDHLPLPAEPMTLLAAIARETSRLRLSTIALCNDFRHPVVLAKQIATLDVLSDGRAEIGLGAGHTRSEFDQAGIRFDSAAVRIARLEEAVQLVRALLRGEPVDFAGTHFDVRGLRISPLPVQQPAPPILVGGGGRKLLALAAQHADIVAIAPQAPLTRSTWSWASEHPHGLPPDPRREMLAGAIVEKLDWVRTSASTRWDQIEVVSRLTAVVTDDAQAGAERCLAGLNAMITSAIQHDAGKDSPTWPDIPVQEVLDSPCFAIGPVDEIVNRLRERRDRLGLAHYTVYGTSPEEFAPVVQALTGS